MPRRFVSAWKRKINVNYVVVFDRKGKMSYLALLPPKTKRKTKFERFHMRTGRVQQNVVGLLFDHRRSVVVCNFGRVCLFVCQTIASESLDVESSYL